MSSASEIDHAAISENQLAQTLSKVKSSRETEALRARLPAQLAPFASNISIVKPTKSTRTSRLKGTHCCSCGVKERKIYMSVAVVPASPDSPNSQSQDSESERPQAKLLNLVWKDWWTTSMYETGSADSRMHSISLKYGHRGSRSEVTAFTGWYQDPGISLDSRSSHGNMKSIVEEVAQDMGFREGELDNKVEVIEALLGDDGRQLLESHAEEGKTLRKIIEDEIEEEVY